MTVLARHPRLGRELAIVRATSRVRKKTEKNDWRAVLVDLRMHGASQDFSPPHTLAACVADLRALENSIGPFHGVIGHSFGGKVALELVGAPPRFARRVDPRFVARRASRSARLRIHGANREDARNAARTISVRATRSSSTSRITARIVRSRCGSR